MDTSANKLNTLKEKKLKKVSFFNEYNINNLYSKLMKNKPNLNFKENIINDFLYRYWIC